MILNDICEVYSGYALKEFNDTGDGLPVIKIGNILTDGTLNLTECQFTSEKINEKYYSQKDDVYVALSGATTGKIGILKSDDRYVVNQRVGIVRKKSNEVPNEFIKYYLLRQADRILQEAAGCAQPNISPKQLGQYVVPDYDIGKMNHIVNVLNRLTNIIKERNDELSALDELIKARFVELFGNPVRNSMEWETYQLDECLERIDNGKSFVCSDKPREDNYPAVLKLSAATYGDYRPSENKALLDEKQFVESAEVHAGDLLFTRKNTPELVGMAAYVQETPSKLMMPDLIFRLVPNEKMNAVFLWQLINCKDFRPVIQAISGGSAKSMSNISKERLGKIKVICPPRELQESLVPFIKQVDKSKVV
ncbi:hypothetical protein CSX00_08440 [Pseudobutyrivibrio ruminis]|uniref:Type I restriction modification DNA specificity domain-containing protein n=1 Tax=Pseudobutyrivibrio ruminis TaxID=46206 RepID=A0A2G3E9D4_9FIRM|nr:restriction endonuclease subunit S [Pseudobutyrivibrio ruminis]PHU39928.1 hypothetical protein CSX00_08440 [Pseudobutyrivibrio ruminis]